MTIQTMNLALCRMATLADAMHASSEARGTRMLIALFEHHEKENTALFLKRALPKRKVGSSWGSLRVDDLLPAAQAYHDMLQNFATNTVSKEFGLVVEYLQMHRGSGIAELISAANEALSTPPRPAGRAMAGPNQQLVAGYVTRLKNALGSDKEFVAVFAALKADRAARKQEVVEIAKHLLSSPPSNLDRKSGLSAIQDLHKTTRGFNLKLKAMAGRSAA